MRPAARLTIESILLGAAAGLVVVAPWTAGGYLLLLDWVSGPHQALNAGLYGLDPAALDALPFRLGLHLLRDLFGPRATGWLVVWAYFPIAAGGISALAAGGRWRRHSAALLMCCNPLVVERIRAGHLPFLLAVSLLTWLLASALAARRRGKPFAARPAGWYALAMAVSPHAAWLGGAGLLAVALLPRPRLVDAIRTAMIVVCAGGVYLYGAVVALAGLHPAWVTDNDLEAYAPEPGPGGLLLTVASLHGFWRGGGELPRDLAGPALGGLLLAVALVAVCSGLVLGCRRDPDLASPLVALTVTGLVLGCGIHGPLGGLYRAAFRSVPLFEVMREQQKWVALAAIGYAVGLGVAAEALAAAAAAALPGRGRWCCRWPAGARGRWPAWTRRRRGLAAPALLGAIGFAIVPTLAWGLGGSVTAAAYPAAWQRADELMGEGDGAVLFLPWHAYQPFPFTGGRTVATPASACFRRRVLSGDAVELDNLRSNGISQRGAYVDRLVAAAGGGGFGRRLAALGVEYVLLARGTEDAAYGWVGRSADLQPVLLTQTLELYRVDAAGTGRVGSARRATFESATTLAERDALGTEALLPDWPDEGPLPSSASGGIRRRAATRWEIDAGSPGWVVIPEEWSSGWSISGKPGTPTIAGTVAFRVGPRAATVEYWPWHWLRIGLAVSMLSLAGLLLAGLAEHWRAWSGWLQTRVQTRRQARVRALADPGQSGQPGHPASAAPGGVLPIEVQPAEDQKRVADGPQDASDGDGGTGQPLPEPDRSSDEIGDAPSSGGDEQLQVEGEPALLEAGQEFREDVPPEDLAPGLGVPDRQEEQQHHEQ